jgi:Protein of unknown function (DUF3043)
MVGSVRFLRRRSDDDVAAIGTGINGSGGATDIGGADDPDGNGQPTARSRTPGKGRPTPKRRDVEARRRGPAPPPPKTQREAAKLARKNRASRQERRAEAADRYARMRAGDDRVLPPRDRGPVKAYVRDLVDARRHLIGLFMPLTGLVLVSLVVPVPRLQSMVSLFCMVMLVAIVIEGVLLGRRVLAAVRERFPKEQVSGLSLGWYAFSRASQLRRLRMPKPKVKVGGTV